MPSNRRCFRRRGASRVGQNQIGTHPDQTLIAPPPELMEELVEEIPLRFPPHDPALLFRASLVCKRWCRLISSPAFRRRFRELHRTPPMLGFHCRAITDYDGVVGRFVPTAAFHLPHAETRSWSWRVLDARHGRVLLRCPGKRFDADIALAVWDPVTDEKRKLPLLHRNMLTWTAAVLCSATAGACDHLDCCRGPFLVVVVGTNIGGTFIRTRSSDAAASWSEPIFSHQNGNSIPSLMRSALMGGVLYFEIFMSDKALRYDLELREVSLVQLPPKYFKWDMRVLTTTEDGGLGFATTHGSKLYMWSRNDGPQLDAGWTQNRVLELETLLPSYATSPDVVGFAEGIGAIFVRADDVLFTIDLKTCKVKKVCQGKGIHAVVPYMSFYTPALGAACAHEGTKCSAGGSSA
ncbi:unnamed protein product [Urochloa humidicola]